MFVIDKTRVQFLTFQRKIFRKINRTQVKILIGMTIMFLLVYANWGNFKYVDISCYDSESDDDLPPIKKRPRVAASYYLCTTTMSCNISCHYIELDDDLPPIENHRLQSTKKHIYFHETSCNGFLDPRQACVVESAARLHPDWQINLAFSAPMNMSSRAKLNPFQKFSNVKFWRVNILKYLNNTPLEYLLTKEYLKKSDFVIHHAADVLRLVTLFNWDGVYLDLDALLAKPLYDLGQNFATRENDKAVSNGILAFSNDGVGRSIAKEVLREIAATFNGRVFNYNGPGAITRVLQRRCNTKKSSQMNMRTCKGFQVYGPLYFYPISWTQGRKYFETGHWLNDYSYGYHFWNARTEHFTIANSSTLAQLAKIYCPLTFQLNKAHFGFLEETHTELSNSHDMNLEER